jgi:hypothetical protein
MEKVFATADPRAARIKRIAVTSDDSQSVDWQQRVGFNPDGFVARPCTAEQLFAAMDRLLTSGGDASERVPAEVERPQLVTAGTQS